MFPFVSLEVFPQAINPATVKGKAAGLQAQVLQMGKGVPSSPPLGTSRGQRALREPVVQGHDSQEAEGGRHHHCDSCTLDSLAVA